ncbi:hypothetical protein NQ292_27705, partial [Escherichia coli]|nr:hypothetical protein [Escherichia coli]
ILRCRRSSSVQGRLCQNFPEILGVRIFLGFWKKLNNLESYKLKIEALELIKQLGLELSKKDFVKCI